MPISYSSSNFQWPPISLFFPRRPAHLSACLSSLAATHSLACLCHTECHGRSESKRCSLTHFPLFFVFFLLLFILQSFQILINVFLLDFHFFIFSRILPGFPWESRESWPIFLATFFSENSSNFSQIPIFSGQGIPRDFPISWRDPNFEISSFYHFKYNIHRQLNINSISPSRRIKLEKIRKCSFFGFRGETQIIFLIKIFQF